MGDDPLIPDVRNEAFARESGTSASGGNAVNIYHNNIGKPGLILLVSMIGFALAVSIVSMVAMAYNQSVFRDEMRDKIETAKQDMRDRIDNAEKRNIDRVAGAEKRAMDYAYLAKQEARLALEEATKSKENK